MCVCVSFFLYTHINIIVLQYIYMFLFPYTYMSTITKIYIPINIHIIYMYTQKNFTLTPSHTNVYSTYINLHTLVYHFWNIKINQFKRKRKVNAMNNLWTVIFREWVLNYLFQISVYCDSSTCVFWVHNISVDGFLILEKNPELLEVKLKYKYTQFDTRICR